MAAGLSAGRRPSVLVVALVVTLLLAASACGGSGGETSAATGGPAADSTASSSADPPADTDQPDAPGPLAAGAPIAAGADEALVRRLQQTLKQLGFDPGPVDGIYGPLTTKAVRAFQRQAGIEATGKVDVATAQALDGARG